MTREEWEDKWWDIHQSLIAIGRSPMQAFEETNRRMERTFGPRPEEEKGPAGPPLWLKFLSPLIGVPISMLNKVWEFLNGKKTLIGAIITLLSVVATQLGVLLPLFGLDGVLVAKIVGVATFAVGVAHKIYKFIYKEDHP